MRWFWIVLWSRFASRWAASSWGFWSSHDPPIWPSSWWPSWWRLWWASCSSWSLLLGSSHRRCSFFTNLALRGSFIPEWDLYWGVFFDDYCMILNQIWQVWQMYLVACFPSIVERLCFSAVLPICSDHELVHRRHRSPIPHRFCGFRGGLLPPFVTVSDLNIQENHTTSGMGKTWNLKLEYPNQWILYIQIIRNKFESDLLEMMVVLRSHKYHSCHITDVEEKDDEEEEVPFE